ncbi:hypothetical protein BG846_05212 [Streptomyces fradiae ATCC 10745 = DSM 40063]|uniref:Uncharacterized protein n=1 Tax=Streptomyces fradiae ATCC 10745 = DSM 40063 TaxID=1319510 RepID=A0A1Y2NNX3_STRFR|nr:hypothetical protein BG846_05212 [Streptomyces fradiae ATCC 10745 = DSM 40063]
MVNQGNKTAPVQVSNLAGQRASAYGVFQASALATYQEPPGNKGPAHGIYRKDAQTTIPMGVRPHTSPRHRHA